MSKIKSIILSLVLSLITVTAVLASDISGAEYYGTITITNNGTAKANLCVPFTTNTTALITNGFLDSNANYVTVRDSGGNDVAFMPAPSGTTSWSVFVPTIGASSYLNYSLYTSHATMSSIRYYFPAAGGMTSNYSATLQPSNNFTIEQKGFIDTSGITTSPALISLSASTLNQSGTMDAWNPTLLVNGNTGDTGFYTNTPGVGSWVMVDFGSGNTTAIAQWQYYASDTAVKCIWDIQYSADNITWTTAYTGLNMDGSSGWHTANITIAVSSRYWRTYKTNAPENGGSHTELRIYTSNRYIKYLIRKPTELEITADSGNVTALIYPSTNITAAVSATEHTVNITLSNPLLFDGNNDYLSCGNSTTLNLGAVTIEVWFYHELATTEQALVKKGLWSGTITNYSLDVSVTQKLRGFCGYTTGWTDARLTGTTTLALNTLYHGVYTYDLATANLYLNGVSDAAPANIVITPASNSVPLVIGAWGEVGGLGTYFNGVIQNVRIYNRALNSTEVLANYNLGRFSVPSNTSGLVGYWKVNEGTGTSVTDYSGSGNTGTVSGAAWNASDFRIIVDGTEATYSTSNTTLSVLDNTQNWAFLLNNSMPYMEYQKIYIGGVLQQYVYWENSSTTFSDQSGKSHPVTPTFRTTSSDSSVSAILSDFQPIDLAQAPAYAISAPPPFISTTPVATSNFTTSINGTMPGSDIITDVSAASNTPPQLLFNILGGFTIIALSMATSWISKKTNTKSLIPKMAVITLITGVFVATRIFDWWMMLLFWIFALAFGVASRHMGW